MTLSHVPIATSVYLLNLCEFTALLPELNRDSGSFKRAARFRFAIFDPDACTVYLRTFAIKVNHMQLRITHMDPMELYLNKGYYHPFVITY